MEQRPETWAAVQISRCPNCDEFPCEWNSTGMPCSECGVELMSDVAVGADGSELWTFDFADQADYDRKHDGLEVGSTSGLVDHRPDVQHDTASKSDRERNDDPG